MFYRIYKTMGFVSPLSIAQFHKLLPIFCIRVHKASYMQIGKCQFITVRSLLQQTDVKGSVVGDDDAIVCITYYHFMDLWVSRSIFDICECQSVNGRGHWFDLRCGINKRMKDRLPLLIYHAYLDDL